MSLGSAVLVFLLVFLGWRAESLGRLHYNLGAAPVDAKGTTWDYLAHPSAIPVQIMAPEPGLFSGG